MKLGIFALVAAGFVFGVLIVALPLSGALAIKSREFAACENMETEAKKANCVRSVAAKACKSVKNRETRAACVEKVLKNNNARKHRKRV